jgi:hypothetical protein
MSDITANEIKATPDARMTGKFSLYDTADGGIHIAYLPDGTEETQHMVIPGKAIQLARMMESGKLNPASLMRAMMGGQG